MMRRLVLGCSSLGRTLVDGLRDRPGDLHVITDDPGWVTTLRETNVAAAEADPVDPSSYPVETDLIVVAGSDPEQNLAIATAARDAFPDAYLLVYPGSDRETAADDTVRARLDAVADRMIDPVRALADRTLRTAGVDTDEREARLLSVLRGLSGPLAVVTHDNPDPDAIGSALGIARVAETVGIPADPCYGGEISHQENRALVNALDIPLVHLEDVLLETYGGIALVDHSRPGVNDSLPEDTDIDIVVDHHPPRGPVEGNFIDIRPEVGATSTLVTEYLDRLGIDPDWQLATALLYGIQVDTRRFTREVSTADFEAAAHLLPSADEETLERVESPTVSPETFSVLARAIRDRDVRGSVIASCVGEISDRDALAQAAERLLDMEGVYVTFVYGYMNGTVYASSRARGADIDLGETLREALGQIGSAGGHADMAGAQIPLGILSEVQETEDGSLKRVVREFVGERFFETIADAPAAPGRGTVQDGLEGIDGYEFTADEP